MPFYGKDLMPLTSNNYAVSPYDVFKSRNTPPNDPQASKLASNLMSGYSKTSYAPKTAQDYIPKELLGQLGQVTSRFSNYVPEKITMPAEFYQKQIEDLTQPLTKQYERARVLTRGDQAARGTIYDSAATDVRVPGSLGQLDESYLEQLGKITRGVQLNRMGQEYQEGADRRNLNLEAMTRGGSLISGAAGLYGNLGQGESELSTRTALQQAGIDANTINSLLGYNADRYGTEANLFSNIYGADVTDIREREQQQRQAAALLEQQKRQAALDLLGLTGYTDQPQGQLWDRLVEQLGYKLSPRGSVAEPKRNERDEINAARRARGMTDI